MQRLEWKLEGLGELLSCGYTNRTLVDVESVERSCVIHCRTRQVIGRTVREDDLRNDWIRHVEVGVVIGKKLDGSDSVLDKMSQDRISRAKTNWDKG